MGPLGKYQRNFTTHTSFGCIVYVCVPAMGPVEQCQCSQPDHTSVVRVHIYTYVDTAKVKLLNQKI